MQNEIITPSAVRQEADGWIIYLNEIVGVLCFTLAIEVADSPNHVFYGIASFVFVTFFHLPNFRRRARILTHLVTKRNRNSFDELVLKDLQAQISFRKLGVLIIGYASLFIVTTGSFVFEDFPTILSLIYGSNI